jgi:hypothetical protein
MVSSAFVTEFQYGKTVSTISITQRRIMRGNSRLVIFKELRDMGSGLFTLNLIERYEAKYENFQSE